MNSYGKVYHLGTREVSGILDMPVYVEEKVDGSQFSFGKKDGELWVASRGGFKPLDTDDKMFTGAIATAVAALPSLIEGWTFRGEAMRGERHNKLTYGRVPPGNFMLFDVQDEEGRSLGRPMVEECAVTLNVEPVALVAPAGHYSRAQLDELVVGQSALGRCDREGIVIKQVPHEGKRLKAKIVGAAFREKVGAKPKKGSDIAAIVAQYRTEARWDKQIQHLRDEGKLTQSMKDVGPLMKELASDLQEECHDEIKAVLWPKIWKQIVKGISRGMPEYYRMNLGREEEVND